MSGERQEPDRLRSRDIISLMSPRPLWRLVRGLARAPLDPHYAGSPLAVCWFTNFTCNARCPFCCKAGEIAHRPEFPPLDLPQARELLARIRRSVEILYLSGGEPLLHPLLPEILRAARALHFTSVGMSTNLILLDRQPEVLDSLDALSISIHAPDAAGHAAQLGVPLSTAQRVFENLERVKAHRARRPLKVIVNCVINPGNVDRVLEMVEFTRRYGVLLELAPANEHGRRPAALAADPRYAAVIDRILELRRAGQAEHLAGSTAYYRRIRGFEPFRCFPYGVPNIMPDGRLCTPCDVAAQYAVNVLDFEDLKAAVRASLPLPGAYPCRQGCCFKAGIVERSRLFGVLCGA